jgi:DNA-binding CsgD family transcriptional regulator
LLALLLGANPLVAQELPQIGVPPLQNFTPSEYQNQGKVWDIESAPNGIVYMAAEKGLLEFDGNNWNSMKGSDGFTRSVYVANDSLIYTGSDLDFGVWKKNQFYGFEYRSLYPFREELVELNEEFWDVYPNGDNILFISASNIYVYHNENLTKISAPNRFEGSFAVGDSIYFADEESGLFLLQDLSLTKVFSYPNDDPIQISGIYKHQDALNIVTYNSGIYRYDGETLLPVKQDLSQILESANVFSFERTGTHSLVFGTVMDGLIIADAEGSVLQRISRSKGLSNNTILSLHYDTNGTLWLGTDYGISSVDLNSNLSFVYDYRGEFGTGHTAQLSGETLYLGTNRGLYYTNWSNLNNSRDTFAFDLIPGSDGQVWTMKELYGELFVGHDRGLLTLSDNRLSTISNQRGIWTLIPFRDLILAGTYNGIAVFENVGGSWQYQKQAELISGSVNQLIAENERIVWINIPNYGFIRAELDENLYPAERIFFTTELFEGDNPTLQKNGQEIQVQTDLYTYSYSQADTSFNILNEIQFESELTDELPAANQPTKLNNGFSFIPVYNGFALKGPGKINTASETDSLRVLFRYTEAFNTQNRVVVSPGATIEHHFNNIQIEYLVPNQQNIYYQHRLNGGEWSRWTSENSIEFIDLSPGEYELSVRAMVDEHTTEEASMSFVVAAPWYKTRIAYLIYFIFAAAGIYLITLWEKKSHRRQQKEFLRIKEKSLKKQADKHNRQMMEFEKERLQSDFDQLKKQLRNKTIELANKARENQDKNKLLTDLKKKIERIQENPEGAKTRWKEIHSTLDSFINKDDNTFEIQMDELHQEFYQRLKDSYPSLSVNDLRLCAYLKLGFTSKEIAEFMSIQPSSVYISRSRLRKKLDLDTEDDLHDFLNTI